MHMEVELVLPGLGTRLYSVGTGKALESKAAETEVGLAKERACQRGSLSCFPHQTKRGVNPLPP